MKIQQKLLALLVGVLLCASNAYAMTGACCLADGCMDGTEDECVVLGGVYLGDGTDCVSDSGMTLASSVVSFTEINVDDLIVQTNTVNSSFPIFDLDVQFNATHSYTADLVVTLESPAGTVVTLMSQDLCGSDDDPSVVFDDEGPGIVCGNPISGSGPGTEPLSAFDGEEAMGDWTLTVDDRFFADGGELESWALLFDRGIAATCQGACCTDGPGTHSDCVEATQGDCETDGGLYIGGSCAIIDDCEPLYVEFDELMATTTPDGVLVRWTTLVEIDTVGFRVLRESGAGREKSLKVVSDFLPAAGWGLKGASYGFLDGETLGGGGTVYYIEDLDGFGRTTRHGPIAVTGSRQQRTTRRR